MWNTKSFWVQLYLKLFYSFIKDKEQQRVSQMTLEHPHADKQHGQRKGIITTLACMPIWHTHHAHLHTEITNNQIIKQTYS